MRNQVSESERRRIMELAAEGHSLNKLGQLAGRDPKTVKTILENEKDPHLHRTNDSG
ncbi:helix-turn-helix domain-containing protein [Microbacterium schleiferi]|uniref:helix-turn-helix domain-containing protein n=1 Tax=Microbacterium schleiferi TaxID=69362 RepID=UPI0038CC1532